MCTVLKVKRSGYYEWLKSQEKPNKDDELVFLIKEIIKDSRQTDGSRRIKQALEDKGHTVSRRKICRLMKENGLFCKAKRKFKVTTNSNHKHPIAPNLLKRKFNVTAPNKFFVGDITYINTKEGWLYLAVVIDLFSRKIVGWSMDKNMTSALVNDALLMALWNRRPAKGLIWHTDQGCQYASESHRNLLKEHGIVQSMSRRGNCWDNAVSESFFHTLKIELDFKQIFESREQAKQEIFEYIEVFYNNKRMHSSINYLSPQEFEISALAA